MNNTKNKKNNIYEVSVVAIVTSIIYIILLGLKGVYPFGDNAFIFVDDGYQQNLATLYYLWDVLHGVKSLSFDFDISFGSNMAGMISHFGMFSPINLIYFIIPRNLIIQSTIWTLMVRLVLASLSMRYLVRYIISKYVNSNESTVMFSGNISPLVVFISISYVYSNWAMRYFSFFQWIDEAILLPICIVMLMKMFSEKEKIAAYIYSLVLSLILIINVQQAYAVLFFLIIFSACYIIFFDVDIKDRKRCVFMLGFYTVIALLLGCIILLPAAYQITHAARLGDGNIIYKIKQIFRSNKNPDITYVAEKYSIFISLICPLVFTTVLVIIRRIKLLKLDKSIIGAVVLSALCIAPVFVESIHYIWQGGTYVCFPLRAGEIIVLSVLFLFTVAVAKTSNDLQYKKYSVMSIAISILFICAALSSVFSYSNKYLEVGDFVNESDMYHYGQIFHDMDEAIVSKECVDRYKNEVSHPNTALVSGLSGNANYMHLMTEEIIKTNKILGYKQYYTKLSDEGGTVFTDSILGYKYEILRTNEELNRDIYSDVKFEQDDIKIVELNNFLPFGMYINQNVDVLSMEKEGKSYFEIQNEIYRSLNNAWQNNLFTEIDSEDNIASLQLPVDGKYILYMYVDYDEAVDLNGAQTELVINDVVIDYTYGIKMIPENLYNSSDDGMITISANTSNGVLHVAYMDINLLSQLNEGRIDSSDNINNNDNNTSETKIYSAKIEESRKRVIIETANLSDHAELLFIPISNFKGWSCYAISGANDITTANNTRESLAIENVFGCFIGVYVPSGFEGVLVFNYQSPWLVLGVVSFVIGLLLLAADIRFNICSKLSDIKLLSKTIYLCYCSIIFGIIFIAYGLNILLAVVHLVV